MLLSVGAVNGGEGGGVSGGPSGVHRCDAMWSGTMCIVLVVCVLASAVFAPSLMEDFSGVTMENPNISLKSAILKRLKT